MTDPRIHRHEFKHGRCVVCDEPMLPLVPPQRTDRQILLDVETRLEQIHARTKLNTSALECTLGLIIVILLVVLQGCR